jgi:hypothetical protein
MTSTNLQTEFLLQFQKQQEDSAMYWLATDHNNNDKTKKQRMTGREKKT